MLLTLFKKRLWHRFFHVNFEKFLRTPFLQNTSEQLLLEITKSCTLKYFQKIEVYSEPIQIPKMELFVKLVNSLMPLTILTKCSILGVWLGCKNATKSFNRSLCDFNIFSFSSHLFKYFSFRFTLQIFISSNIQKRSSSFVVQNLLLFKEHFWSNPYDFFQSYLS